MGVSLGHRGGRVAVMLDTASISAQTGIQEYTNQILLSGPQLAIATPYSVHSTYAVGSACYERFRV